MSIYTYYSIVLGHSCELPEKLPENSQYLIIYDFFVIKKKHIQILPLAKLCDLLFYLFISYEYKYSLYRNIV